MKGSKCKCAGREAAEIIGSLQSEKDMKAWAAGEAGLPPRSASVQKQGSKEVRPHPPRGLQAAASIPGSAMGPAAIRPVEFLFLSASVFLSVKWN